MNTIFGRGGGLHNWSSRKLLASVGVEERWDLGNVDENVGSPSADIRGGEEAYLERQSDDLW